MSIRQEIQAYIDELDPPIFQGVPNELIDLLANMPKRLNESFTTILEDPDEEKRHLAITKTLVHVAKLRSDLGYCLALAPLGGSLAGSLRAALLDALSFCCTHLPDLLSGFVK